MKKFAYNQINPLIRLKETELLSNTQYEQLLSAQKPEELKEILSSTIYEPYLTEDFIDHFDYILGKERGLLYAWLYELAPEPEVVSIYTSRLTFHNLKVLTKAEVTNQNLDHLFINDGRYSLEEMKNGIRTKKSTELSEFMLASIEEVFDYLDEYEILQGIDIIYDRRFLTYQRQLAEALGSPEILNEVIAFIDLTNISIMGRGMIQGQHETFLSTVLSSSGSIPKKDFLPFAKQSLADFTSFVLQTKYGPFLKPAVSAETGELNMLLFDRMKDGYLAEVYNKASIVAFGPLPLLAFLNAKELEWKKLRLIFVGKRSNFPDEQIRERMGMISGL